MPSPEIFTDDYVASLLTKDAKASTARYSTAGLTALLPSRPTTNAPKANTRFLRNIIKETDSHNAALREKETQDAKARLRRIRSDFESSKTGERHRDEDDRHVKRQRLDLMNDEESAWGRISEKDPLRKKKHHDEYVKPHRHHKVYYTSDDDLRRHSHHRRHRHHHRRHHRHSRSPSEGGDTKKARGRNSTTGNRSRSPRVDPEYRHNHRRRRRRSRSSSSRNTPNSHMLDSAPSKTQCSPNPGKPHNDNGRHQQQPPTPGSQDSDPLDLIIGPRPPPPAPKVQARGRGTFASSSTIDVHFSSHYDPATDVRPDSDIDDDWDQALEALRDRQRWKQQGADRLRAAGFTEEAVSKWEKSGGEKREEDVRWRRRGESREWDRGKVVGEDGVETKAEWGRLKGT